MCGIAGIVKWEHHPDADAVRLRSGLDAMSRAIAHRGPDGRGEFLDQRPGRLAALLHRRLAIIDLARGAQPMANEDSSVHVSFNGEIYNHAELRRELQSAGHRFATDHSDTEVLIHGWEQWGVDLPARLLGMFAFCIWDTRLGADGRPAETLFLARDRMGQKPLFYASLEDGLVFGSTIPSVLAWPEVPRRLPREQIALFLLLGYIPPPQTIWRDIAQVQPGAWIRLRREVLDGQIYWTPTSTSTIENRKSKAENANEALRTLLQEAVRSQLIADVPLACFLSGGIDSSIIAALMQQQVRTAGGDSIQTVSAGFAESSFDETNFAAAVAEKIGSRHTRLEVAPDRDPLATLAALTAQSLGQPFADASLLPTYRLSKAVREIAPVALSGDGADELFAGYDRYRAMILLQRYGKLSRLLPRELPLGNTHKRERYRRLAAAAREKSPADQYTALTAIFPPELIADLLHELPTDTPPHSVPCPGGGQTSALRNAMLRDQVEYLPGDVLYKVDTASMAVALEVRSPFLDHRVVEGANALPDSALLRGKIGKAILRDTFAPELPALVRDRAKKGFAAPIAHWLRGQWNAPALDLLFAPGNFLSGIVDSPTLQRLWQEHQSGRRDHSLRLFALISLELFAREFRPTVE